MIKFPVSVVIAAVDKWSGNLTAMQKKVQSTFAPVHELGDKLRLAGETAGVNKLGEAFAGVGSSVARVGRTLAFFSVAVTGAVGGAIAALYHLASHTAHVGNEAAKAARKLGIGVVTYQELSFAANMADVDQEAFRKGLGLMVRNLGLASMGNKKAASGFQRLGIQIKDTDGKIRPVSKIFGEVSDKLNLLHDPLRRTAIGAMIFGRGASQLTNMLTGGSEGLAKMAQEAHKFGIVIDADGIKRSEEFIETQKRMAASFEGVKNSIGLALLPAFSDLGDKVTRFFTEHRQEIADYARRFAEGLPERLRQLGSLFDELVEDLRPVVGLVRRAVEAFGPMPVAVTSVGLALSVSLVPAILSTVASLTTLSVALVSTPAGWVVLAISAIVIELAALGAGIVYFWNTWKDLWGSIKLTATLALAVIKTNVSVFADELTSTIAAPFVWLENKIKGLSSIVPDWVMQAAGFGKGIDFSQAPQGAAPPADAAARATRAAGGNSSAKVKVEFSNAPKGLRVTETQNDGTDLDISLGYSMLGGF